MRLNASYQKNDFEVAASYTNIRASDIQCFSIALSISNNLKIVFLIKN